MFRFQESEVREDLESDKGTRDLNSSLENSQGEGNHQYIKGWSLRERGRVRVGAMFHTCRDGEIHPSTDQP